MYNYTFIKYFIFLVSILFIFANCSDNNTKDGIMNNNTDQEYSAEIGYQKIKNYLEENKLDSASKEYLKLSEKFNDSPESKLASDLITEYAKAEEFKILEESKKNASQLKNIKEATVFNIDHLKLKFNSITTSTKWTFDISEYGNNYFPAERGNSFVIANVSFTSDLKESNIPLISLFEYSRGRLVLVGIMKRQFVNNPNGSYSDVDFKYVKTVSLSHAIELPTKTVESSPLFIVVKKDNCSYYKRGYYLQTHDINGKVDDQCDIKYNLSLRDFDEDYVLVKILNKRKL